MEIKPVSNRHFAVHLTALNQHPLLNIIGLNIHAGKNVLASLPQLAVRHGESYGIIGESGSGKSLTLLAIMGLLPKGVSASGNLNWHDGTDTTNMLLWPEESRRQMRGASVGMIFQEPMSALNPQRTCGWQLEESVRVHEPGISRTQLRDRCLTALTETGLEDPERILVSYPHQISGGQRQRVMIAMATIHKPGLVLADEPTTALDPETGHRVMEALVSACKKNNSSLILVSHDLDLVSRYCGHITVMRHGQTLVSGATAEVLHGMQRHPYVDQLLDAAPVAIRPALENHPDELIVSDISKTYRDRDSALPALQHLNFSLAKGEGLALVGFSGSGKTTAARILTGLEKADQGQVIFRGTDLLTQKRTGIQMVFQDPYSSLNAEMRNCDIIGEVLQLRKLERSAADLRCRELFRLTGLPEALLMAYPHQLSGGQRQRLCIARALASEPDVLVLDEAVAALDPLVQKQVLDLLIDIQLQTGIIYIFITHNLAAATYLCHKCLELAKGQVTWYGDSARFVNRAEE